MIKASNCYNQRRREMKCYKVVKSSKSLFRKKYYYTSCLLKRRICGNYFRTYSKTVPAANGFVFLELEDAKAFYLQFTTCGRSNISPEIWECQCDSAVEIKHVARCVNKPSLAQFWEYFPDRVHNQNLLFMVRTPKGTRIANEILLVRKIEI